MAGFMATPGCCWLAGPRPWPPRGPEPCCCRTPACCCCCCCCICCVAGTACGIITGTGAGLAAPPLAAAAAKLPGRCGGTGAPAAGITGMGAADTGCCAATCCGRDATAGVAADGTAAGAGAGGGVGLAATAAGSLTTSVGSMSPNLMEGCRPSTPGGSLTPAVAGSGTTTGAAATGGATGCGTAGAAASGAGAGPAPLEGAGAGWAAGLALATRAAHDMPVLGATGSGGGEGVPFCMG